jgi:hypothetical protein
LSVKVQSLVWEHAPYRGNTLLAFLALADWSDDEGLSWPNMPTLAKKSRQSVRSAQYAVELLVRDEFLAVDVNPGRGRNNEFRINMQKLHLLANEKVQNVTIKGAKRDSVIRKNRQEPSSTKTLPNPPLQGGNRVTKRDLQKVQKQIQYNRARFCKKHPDSGLTQWGTCAGCYYARYSNGEDLGPQSFFPVDNDELRDVCEELLLHYEDVREALDEIQFPSLKKEPQRATG